MSKIASITAAVIVLAPVAVAFMLQAAAIIA